MDIYCQISDSMGLLRISMKRTQKVILTLISEACTNKYSVTYTYTHTHAHTLHLHKHTHKNVTQSHQVSSCILFNGCVVLCSVWCCVFRAIYSYLVDRRLQDTRCFWYAYYVQCVAIVLFKAITRYVCVCVCALPGIGFYFRIFCMHVSDSCKILNGNSRHYCWRL